MKNRLIPLSDYVLEVHKDRQKPVNGFGDFLGRTMDTRIIDYTLFLKQNLSEPYEVNGVTAHPLNRFVPTDLEGNVLEDPNSSFNLIGKTLELEFKQYTEAKSRVLFDGFEDSLGVREIVDSNLCIENIINLFTHYITLTPTGAKMCGRG